MLWFKIRRYLLILHFFISALYTVLTVLLASNVLQ